ncbi:hypothetical protein ACIBQ6_34520 [Nonomuraea sp. NPDC049655]|uniref:hypothetical protein n=1 Tax=Nonomuraea sp. NPDC049655 TaxID=3364355 RepID=UPI0037B8FCC7
MSALVTAVPARSATLSSSDWKQVGQVSTSRGEGDSLNRSDLRGDETRYNYQTFAWKIAW